MGLSFRIVALEAGRFAPLFSRSDAELAAMGARRVVVDEHPGFPCRVSLADAQIGETVLLLSFTHHDVTSPYRASGPIFIRAHMPTLKPKAGEIPKMLVHRLLSLRAYDSDAMMVNANVVSGNELAQALPDIFSNHRVSYVHIHNAKPGCYNCSAVRA